MLANQLQEPLQPTIDPMDQMMAIQQDPANQGNVVPYTPIEPELSEVDKLFKEIFEEEKKCMEDFQYCRSYLNELITSWVKEEQKTEANRAFRDIEVDVDELRESEDIDEDEGMYPVRVVDNNIMREMPPYINFIKNSRRLGSFKDVKDPSFDADLLEQEFTRGMTYKGWTKTYYKWVDSCVTHGWSCVEVIYDESKPLHVGIEYVAHEDLIFPCDSKDIQTSSCILRKYKLTALQLKSYVTKFGFDIKQVTRIIEKHKTNTNKDKTIAIYKRFYKFEGAVYVSWFSIEGGCDDWLKAPVKLYGGIDEQKTETRIETQQIPQYDAQGALLGVATQEIPIDNTFWSPVDLENYPIFLLPYRETEEPLIFDHKGRVFYDKDKQEAQTAITTSFVNGITRAQKVFASPQGDSVQDGKPPKQLASMKWANGTIFDKQMNFWNMPYPDPSVLKALQYLGTTNLQDVGQTNFAALNNEDSRKTAKEITSSENKEQLLNSVDLTLFSETLREVLSFAWLIVQSQALQNKIVFLQIKAPQNPAQPDMQLPMTGNSIIDAAGSVQEEEKMVNDIDTIARRFDVRAAGDVDVIQKAELLNQMKNDWPVLQATPIASKFLSDYMKLAYPQDGQVYSKLLEHGDPKIQIIQALATALQGMVEMPDVQQHLTPEMKQGLQQLAQETQAVLQPQQQTQQAA